MTLLTAITDALNAAAAAAATALSDTQTKMDAAVAAVPTSAGDCLEGMIELDDAWSAVAAAFDAAGQAEALRDLVNFGTLSATVLTVPPATGNIDLSSLAALATAQATSAVNDANDARAYVLSREQLVRDAFKGCIIAGALGPLLNLAQTCVSTGIDALNAAVTNVVDPGAPGRNSLPNANLQGMVTALISRAALPVTDDGAQGCNLGVLDLKNAFDLINNAREKESALTTCLGELGAIAPGDPLMSQGQAALTAAHNQITNAQTLLDTNQSVFDAWMNRANCLLKSKDIVIKVRDESGDEMGRGVQVAVGNPVIDLLLPHPVAPLPTECPGSQITFRNVPMAAIPLSPPTGAPPKPQGVPDLPSAATLIFSVGAGGTRTFAAPVNPNGFVMGSNPLEITLQLDEVSSLTSC